MPEHCAIGTMFRAVANANRALAAAQVNAPHNTLAQPMFVRRIGNRIDNTNKLMSQYALEIGDISLHHFQISRADSGQTDANTRFASPAFWFGDVRLVG